MGVIEKEFWTSFSYGKAFQYEAMYTEMGEGAGGERERERGKERVWKSIFSR